MVNLGKICHRLILWVVEFEQRCAGSLYLEIKFDLICLFTNRVQNWTSNSAASKIQVTITGGKMIDSKCKVKQSNTNTPQEFTIAPENWWLEDYFPFGDGLFSGDMLNFRGLQFKDKTLFILFCLVPCLAEALGFGGREPAGNRGVWARVLGRATWSQVNYKGISLTCCISTCLLR